MHACQLDLPENALWHWVFSMSHFQKAIDTLTATISQSPSWRNGVRMPLSPTLLDRETQTYFKILKQQTFRLLATPPLPGGGVRKKVPLSGQWPPCDLTGKPSWNFYNCYSITASGGSIQSKETCLVLRC